MAGISFCCHLCKLRLKLSDLRILPNSNHRRTIPEGISPDTGNAIRNRDARQAGAVEDLASLHSSRMPLQPHDQQPENSGGGNSQTTRDRSGSRIVQNDSGHENPEDLSASSNSSVFWSRSRSARNRWGKASRKVFIRTLLILSEPESPLRLLVISVESTWGDRSCSTPPDITALSVNFP